MKALLNGLSYEPHENSASLGGKPYYVFLLSVQTFEIGTVFQPNLFTFLNSFAYIILN
jgi:hypothetical protein